MNVLSSSAGLPRPNGLPQALSQATSTKEQQRAQAEKAAAMLEGLFMRITEGHIR